MERFVNIGNKNEIHRERFDSANYLSIRSASTFLLRRRRSFKTYRLKRLYPIGIMGLHQSTCMDVCYGPQEQSSNGLVSNLDCDIGVPGVIIEVDDNYHEKGLVFADFSDPFIHDVAVRLATELSAKSQSESLITEPQDMPDNAKMLDKDSMKLDKFDMIELKQVQSLTQDKEIDPGLLAISTFDVAADESSSLVDAAGLSMTDALDSEVFDRTVRSEKFNVHPLLLLSPSFRYASMFLSTSIS